MASWMENSGAYKYSINTGKEKRTRSAALPLSESSPKNSAIIYSQSCHSNPV